MSREAEIAWAAGIFEGEGCFCIASERERAKGKTALRMDMAMTDFDTVERFARVMGVGRLYPREKPGNLKDMLKWAVCDRSGYEHAFGLLYPWLSVRRQVRGAEVLRLHVETIESRPPRKPRANNRKLTDEQVREIRSGLGRGEGQYVLADRYAVSQSAVSLIATGRTWSDKTWGKV